MRLIEIVVDSKALKAFIVQSAHPIKKHTTNLILLKCTMSKINEHDSSTN